MEGEIKQFNTEINEIETTINKNNNSFNNDIISLKSKIETNNKVKFWRFFITFI